MSFWEKVGFGLVVALIVFWAYLISITVITLVAGGINV